MSSAKIVQEQETDLGQSQTMSHLTGLIVLSSCLIAAVTDFRYRKIYNAVTYPALGLLVLIGLAETTGLLEGLTLVSPENAVLGFLFAAVLTGTAWYFGQLGGGDVKLALVIGLGFGWDYGFPALLFALLLSAVWAGVCMLFRPAGNDRERKIPIPMGCCFFIATAAVFYFR